MRPLTIYLEALRLTMISTHDPKPFDEALFVLGKVCRAYKPETPHHASEDYGLKCFVDGLYLKSNIRGSNK
jgi:hypothetical protein